jgi:hypothetical protein
MWFSKCGRKAAGGPGPRRSDADEKPAVTKMREDEAALRKERMLIGGKWVDSVSDEWLEVEDRRTGAQSPRCRGAAPKTSHAR